MQRSVKPQLPLPKFTRVSGATDMLSTHAPFPPQQFPTAGAVGSDASDASDGLGGAAAGSLEHVAAGSSTDSTSQMPLALPSMGFVQGTQRSSSAQARPSPRSKVAAFSATFGTQRLRQRP